MLSTQPRVISALFLTLSLAVISCQGVSDSTTEHDEASAEQIAWFDGSVEEAFAYAKESRKPVFLYWGAVWCPPCHYLKDKIFTKPEFVAKSKLFVPVYLDGDTERAQIWGEKLDINGYPTVIILEPDGNEVLRMSSDVPIAEYTEVLDLALAATSPIQEVVASVLETGPGNADRNDLGQLAYHSWGQDSDFDYASEEDLAVARRLWSETPTEYQLERSRFLALYIDTLDAQEEVQVEEEERSQLLAETTALINDPALRNSNWWLFAYGLDTVAPLLTEEGEQRDQLIQQWLQVATTVEADESLTTAERIAAFRPRISAAQLAAKEEEELPEELLKAVREKVQWGNDRTTNPNELQSVMNSMAHLLRDSGLKGEAIELLKNRVDDAVAPYYYMSWIGWLENDAGNTEEAMKWYRKGWDTATGPATRLQRGAGFIRTLMEITPENLESVRRDSLALADEHLVDDSAFSGRNRHSWARLSTAMLEWAEGDAERQEVISAARDAVTSRCDHAALDPESDARATCTSFLEPGQAI